MLFQKGKKLISCKNWYDVPRMIKKDTILEMNSLSTDGIRKNICVTLSKKSSLRIVGNHDRVYRNISFIMQDRSRLILESFCLVGSADNTPLRITAGNCEISASKMSKITMEGNFPSVEMSENSNSLCLCIEDDGSSLELFGLSAKIS